MKAVDVPPPATWRLLTWAKAMQGSRPETTVTDLASAWLAALE